MLTSADPTGPTDVAVAASGARAFMAEDRPGDADLPRLLSAAGT